MKKGLCLLFFTFFATSAFANVAIEELTALLEKKQAQNRLNHTKKQRIQTLRRHYYFIFIYRSSCPHCHQFAPVLKDFISHFALPIKAYSLDGESLAGFDAAPLSPQLFKTLYVSGGYKPVVPALYLVNRLTAEAYAVLFGQAEPAQLSQRLDELMVHLEKKFHD